MGKFETVGKYIGELANRNDYRQEIRFYFDSTGIAVTGRRIHGGENYTKVFRVSYKQLDEEDVELLIAAAIVNVETSLQKLTEPVQASGVVKHG